jgi:hypothetical protein
MKNDDGIVVQVQSREARIRVEIMPKPSSGRRAVDECVA